MAENVIFGKLASNLSQGERQNLLDKLKSTSNITGGVLYFEDREVLPKGDLPAAFSALPWYRRLLYVFLSFFKAKSPIVLYGDNQVAELGQRINERSPGMYDSHQRLLLDGFYQQVKKLRDAARFFYTALDASVNRDKGAFFAFLASLELADVHKKLEVETLPQAIIKTNPDLPEVELRQVAFKIMDDALVQINEQQRDTMYSNARSLNCMKRLSSFLFDRLIMAFNTKNAEKGTTCSVNVVKDMLVTLSNTMISLKTVPPVTLFQSLFFFILQERAGEQGFDINREIRSLLAKAEESLAVIREFNRCVPLTWIIRCCNRNMSFAPYEITGGEDWYLVYRDYWRRRIETTFGDFFRDRRLNVLMESFGSFFKGEPLRVIENIQSSENPDGLPVKGGFTLAFLRTFYTLVYMPVISKVLTAFFVLGQFSKRETRIEFSESYDVLIKLEEDINKFETEISPAGDYGGRYLQVQQEVTALPIKKRRTQLVLDDVEEDVEKILEPARRAFRTMFNIVKAILGQDGKAKEVMPNLAIIAGKGDEFMNGLNEACRQLEIAIKLLDDIQIMEDGR
ncbi:MAG: DUF5312 domain-containing protein [Treponema sp.]|nr:DUF5312 domain-containing protein [Treponema sp.]